jgi:hypothetical protein
MRRLWGSLASCATVVNRRKPSLTRKGPADSRPQDAILPHSLGKIMCNACDADHIGLGEFRAFR